MRALELAVNPQLDQQMPDEEVVRRVLAGETELYEILMRRYNQRLFRVARAILRNDDEAESVMQDAYVAAYTHLAQFEARASFATWLTKIAAYEALARLRRAKRFVDLDSITESAGELDKMIASREPDPEQRVYDGELKTVLQTAIDALPMIYRSVFVLREIEGLDTSETARSLGISEQNVKVRLHRARELMRRRLYAWSGAVMHEAFEFHLYRCDRVVAEVFRRIRAMLAPDKSVQDKEPGFFIM